MVQDVLLLDTSTQFFLALTFEISINNVL